jgi:hypothetical protein
MAVAATNDEAIGEWKRDFVYRAFLSLILNGCARTVIYGISLNQATVIYDLAKRDGQNCWATGARRATMSRRILTREL